MRQRFFRSFSLSLSLTLPSLGLLAAHVHAEDCKPRVESFNQLVSTAKFDAAQAEVDAMAADSACATYVLPAQKRLAASRLKDVQKAMAADQPVQSYEDLLVKADHVQVLWQASATLGDVRFEARRFADAARAYDAAIEIVKNETLTPQAPNDEAIQRLLDRSAQSRLLAANQSQKDGGGFVKTASRGADLGGALSPRVRGVVPHAVPMPITFDYRSATLTPVGEQAVLELARAIKEQHPVRVKLIGHTDERGTDEINEKLSRERADSVAALLRQNDVTVPVEAEGVGSKEPLRVEASSALTKDDIYTLNRRVEWRRD